MQPLSVLLAGESMRPLLDALFVSREKLSFIVDATAAPIASTLTDGDPQKTHPVAKLIVDRYIPR